jgi:hypothetical protein
MWSSIISLFQEYMGTGLVMIWYLLAVVYLLLREEDRTKRCLLVYTPLLILLVFFNPGMMALMERFGDSEIYYRILWLLPVSATILYSLVRIGESLRGREKGFLFGGALVLILLAGKLIYQNGVFHRAENLYHVPDSVVAICDEIRIPGREVMAVFPDELLSYVRQYSPYVCMPYGRNQTVDRWMFWGEDDLHNVMNREEIPGEELGALATSAGCNYIVLAADHALIGEIPGFVWYDEKEGYVLYRSLTADFNEYW